MKYCFILLALMSFHLNAQTGLTFDKRFVESEDKWVTFNMNKDSSFLFGFIYIDAEAGLTFQHEGSFKIAQNGQFMPKKLEVNSKVRLQANNVLVAFIPENRFVELNIQAIPDWLKAYKTDTGTVKRLYRWGYFYNGWDECAKALPFLEKAQKLDAQYKGLEVELAFSYNCLGRYDKAISVLQNVIKKEPTDAYINKELIYAFIKSEQMDKAIEGYKNAIKVCTDKTYHGENSYNILNVFYAKKDKKNFKLWLKEAKKMNSDNKDRLKNIDIMTKQLDE
jgi:tetratricopeptide (TPR) repeat protein